MPGRVPGQVVVNDGVEQLLKVDAFGQAVCSDQNTLNFFLAVGRCHFGHAVAALVGCQNTRHSFDSQFGKSLPQTISDMLGSCQIAAEYHGIHTLLDQWRERIDEGRELWVGFVNQLLCPDDQSQEGGISIEAGAGFDIDSIFVIRVFVIDLRLKPVALIRHSVAEGTEGRRWRRTYTAHQGERAPEGETPFPKPGACARDDTKAVVEHGLLEIEMRLRQPVGRLRRFVLGKCAVLVPFPRNEIDPLALHEMSRQTFPVAGVFEIHRAKGRLDQRKKAAERVLITRVRGGGKKDHSALWIAGKASEQFETLLLALVRSHAGMGFIHDHEIRACPREAFTTLFGLDVVEAHHRVGVGIEQRLGQREAAFQPRGTA